MESGWAQEIHSNLTKVKRGGLDIGVKAAFDDLLSSLVNAGGQEVIDEFQKLGVIQVCQTHMLKELARSISNSASKAFGITSVSDDVILCILKFGMIDLTQVY